MTSVPTNSKGIPVIKSVKKIVSARTLIIHREINARFDMPERYKLDVMLEQICSIGRIVDPPVVEETHEGLVVLKGNRRVGAAKMALENPNLVTSVLMTQAEMEADERKAKELRDTLQTRAQSILEGFQRLDVSVLKDLSVDERDDIINDHGSVLELCRSETVVTVWKKAKRGKSEREIILSMYFGIAKYSGNMKKLAEVEAIKDEKDREKALMTWMHGVVGNQILASLGMGAYIQDQFLKSRMSEDRLLKDGESVELFCSTKRVQELSQAKGKDKDLTKGGKGWRTLDRIEKHVSEDGTVIFTFTGGGETFNEKVQQYIDEDAGRRQVVERKRPSTSDLTRKVDMYRSPGIKECLRLAAGEVGDWGAVLEADDRAYRDAEVLEVIAKHFDRLPEPVKGFAKVLLNGTPATMEIHIAQLIAASTAIKSSK